MVLSAKYIKYFPEEDMFISSAMLLVKSCAALHDKIERIKNED